MKHYKYISSGILLERRVCIGKNYRNFIAPNDDNTEVFTTIEHQQVRDVDAKKQTISVDLQLTLRWVDPRIITNLAENNNNKKAVGITLRPSKVKEIWTPDVYIWDRTALKTQDEWKLLITSKILTNEFEDKEELSTVELKYEIKTTIYCKFEYIKYPMDNQSCIVRIGSSSDSAKFVLYEKDKAYHDSKSYSAVGLNFVVDFFGHNKKGNSVGFDLKMNRLLFPFVLKYYIPSIAIVIVSEIGFMVQLTAIPGRVALLVTQFLTLVNLFIYQMVW